MHPQIGSKECVPSLSSWRAWIEIKRGHDVTNRMRSLSSWRAWIEINMCDIIIDVGMVALLMESVD